MEWLTFLLYAACPLMMLFCMKGMKDSNKDAKAKGANAKDVTANEFQTKVTPQDLSPHNAQDMQPQVTKQEFESLQTKMTELMEQNQMLVQEVQSMKEEQAEKAKREIS